MRFFVNFLGYSESEGGIQEIYPEENNFGVGEISLEDFKPKFSNFSFKCKKSSIFDFYRRADNAIYSLQKSVKSYETTFYINNPDIIDNTLLWIGNERIRIIQKNLDGTYGVERAYNNSISVSHFFDERIFDAVGVTLLSEKRLTPTGLICRFYRTDNMIKNEITMGYGFIESIKQVKNGYVEIDTKPLYEKIIDGTLLKFQAGDTTNNMIPFSRFLAYINSSSEIYSNEFLKLFVLSNQIDTSFEFKVDFKYNSNEYCSADLKKIFETFLNINNSILNFNESLGKYTAVTLDKLISTEQITEIFLYDYININSTTECEIINKKGGINLKLKYNAIDEAGIVNINNFVEEEITLMDFDIASVTDERIDLDLSVINPIFREDAIAIAKRKLLLFNNMNEVITLKKPKFYNFFQIGKTYKILDSHKIDTFTRKGSDVYFKCFSVENDTVRFIYIDSAIRYLVAPALPFKVESGHLNTLTLHLENNLLIDDFLSYQLSSGSVNLTNLYVLGTDKLIFEQDDVIECVSYSAADYFGRTISSVTTNQIILTNNLPSEGLYYVTFPLILGNPENKYGWFLYTGYGNI